MSTVFIDTDIDVVKIVLLSKADRTTTKTVYLSTEYYPADAIYSGSPVVYPLLVSSPVARRSVGNEVGVRHDVSISVFGKTHFEEYGIGFIDVLDSWELTNAEVTILYYAKPRDTTTTHTDSINKRQVLRALEESYEDVSGVVTISARDHWFEDKTFSRELSGDDFPTMDERWDTEIGSHVFGAYEAGKYNTVIDAPLIESGIDGSSRPNAKLFMGWVYPDHPMKQREALLVQNTDKQISPQDWRPCRLVNDPQTAVHGNATFSQKTEPSATGWETDLSRYARSIVYTASTAAGTEILTAVRGRFSVAPFFRCALMTDTTFFRSQGALGSMGDENFTVSFWFYSGAYHATDRRIFAASKNRVPPNYVLDWEIGMSAGSNTMYFLIVDTAGTTDIVVNPTTLTNNTWYRLTAYYDRDTGNIGLYINNAAATTAATTITPERQNGFLEIGHDIDAVAGIRGFNGGIKWFRIWKRLIDATDSTALWNSGEGVHDDVLADNLKVGLVVSFPLDEPKGIRLSYSGAAELHENGGEITYEGTSWAPDITSNQGDLICEIYHVTPSADLSTYTRNGAPLRRSVLDHTTAAIVSGTNNAYFQIDPPLNLIDGKPYAIEFHWTNTKTNARFVRCNVRDDVGSDHYRLNTRVENPAWEIQEDEQLAIELFVLGFGDGGDTLTAGTGSNLYSYIHLEAKSITLSTGQSHLEFNNGPQFKLTMHGVADDVSGTYTGSASAAITYPTDIIRFLLGEVLGISSGNIDTSAFSTARALLVTAGLAMHINLDTGISVREFITELARQGRLIFYKTRDGKLSIKYPVYALPSATLSEERLRGDLILAGVGYDSLSEIVNDFSQFYGANPLNQPLDPAFVRRARSRKYLDEQNIHADSSTNSDTTRETFCSESQALYGRSELRQAATFYQSAARVASLQNYICDRKTRRAQVIRIRIPRRRYYNVLDLFSVVRCEHTGINAQGGTGFDTMIGDTSGNELQLVFEGIEQEAWRGGSDVGEITAIEEEAGYLVLTLKTVFPFSAL